MTIMGKINNAIAVLKEGILFDVKELKKGYVEVKKEKKVIGWILKGCALGVLLLLFLSSFLGGGPALRSCEGKPYYLGCAPDKVYAAGEIDVGSPAVNEGYMSGTNTYVSKVNPVNESGVLTQVQFYVGQAGSYDVGVFYVISGNTLKCREAVVLGALGTGYSEHAVDIEVVAGDYIGFYSSAGMVDRKNTGTGMWKITGDYCTTGAQGTYTSYSNYSLSLYGIGDTPVTDPPAGVTSFTLTAIDDNVLAEWTSSELAEGVMIYRNITGFPDSLSDNYCEAGGWTHHVYQGASDNFTDTYLDLFSIFPYYYSIWEYNDSGNSTGYMSASIGGGDMEISVVFPANYWVFGAAVILLFAAVFFKKLLLYLALIPLWIGVIATAGNPYIDSAAGIVLLFAILSIRSVAKKNAAGGV